MRIYVKCDAIFFPVFRYVAIWKSYRVFLDKTISTYCVYWRHRRHSNHILTMNHNCIDFMEKQYNLNAIRMVSERACCVECLLYSKSARNISYCPTLAETIIFKFVWTRIPSCLAEFLSISLHGFRLSFVARKWQRMQINHKIKTKKRGKKLKLTFSLSFIL